MHFKHLHDFNDFSAIIVGIPSHFEMKCLKRKDVNYINRLFLLAQSKAESEGSAIIKTTEGSISHMATKKMSPKSINPFLLVPPPCKLHRYCRGEGPGSSSPFSVAPFPNISSKGLERIQHEIFSLSNYFLLETD